MVRLYGPTKPFLEPLWQAVETGRRRGSEV